MALTFDFTACPIADPWSDDNKALTEALIWGTMAAGIGTLTRDNLPEFAARLDVSGYWGNGPKPTVEDLLPYVGLRTNVFPAESRAKWLKRVIGADLDSKVAKYRVPA
jgi:hypothetical protein